MIKPNCPSSCPSFINTRKKPSGQRQNRTADPLFSKVLIMEENYMDNVRDMTESYENIE